MTFKPAEKAGGTKQLVHPIPYSHTDLHILIPACKRVVAPSFIIIATRVHDKDMMNLCHVAVNRELIACMSCLVPPSFLHALLKVTQKFSSGTNFRGQASPQKLNARKCAHTN